MKEKKEVIDRIASKEQFHKIYETGALHKHQVRVSQLKIWHDGRFIWLFILTIGPYHTIKLSEPRTKSSCTKDISNEGLVGDGLKTPKLFS